jgi:hypothetical protein
MPQRWIWSTRNRLMLALPWAGLLALSVSLAWAMTVGVTSDAQGVGGPESSQPLPSTGRALDADVDTFPSDDSWLALRRVQGTQKVVTITAVGPAGSVDVYCDTTSELTAFDTVSVRADQLMDLFHQLCSPPHDWS